ncbi:YeaC family protein [Thaumasiovibrio subtropicus]|uniref:YeaC family protein n=1 Tax=Thaumasiovibrio subtropicus TaxID=1891207 RepID=UPI000B360330|nr:DUF1315 family protein [Thaumasiovibrio subtropicus]
MDIETLLNAMTPEIFDRLRYGVETGKWPDGTALTPQQREQAQQAVMLYQSRHNHEASHMSIAAGGEMKIMSKAEMKRKWQGGEDIDVKAI